jgi:MFS family permease
MMNGLNILPSYTDYFILNTTTTALNTASVWVGGAAAVFYARVPDLIGRKWALAVGAAITIIGAIIQAASQNVAMFVIARVIVGFGTGCTAVTVPVYLAETLPVKYRAWGLGLVYNCWYVGGLLAAGVTYGTAKMDSTWAWRLPSLLQGIFSVLCITLLFFTPESARWLEQHGLHEDAIVALAQTHSNGAVDHPAVQLHMLEISQTLEFERDRKPYNVAQVMSDKNSLRRIFLACTVAVFCMLCGNNIVSYYLGGMLTQAGITNSTTQLEINIVLNAWCLLCALSGTFLCDIFGRKGMAVTSTFLCALFMFIIGALTKAFGASDNTSGIYGTVSAIFLFQGSYSIGWTPLSESYLSYVVKGPLTDDARSCDVSAGSDEL